jgi:hypothetical protein
MASESDKQYFLDRLANKIAKQPGDLLVVLPNRRSQYILADRLKSLQVDQDRISIRTADQLMEELSGLELVEPQEALVAFYNAYKKVETSPQSFEEFTVWATTFLQDVNDVDLHLVDIDQLYQQIGEYQSIDLDNAEPGPMEKGFRSFWQRLPDYYRALQIELKSIELGYRGLIYRTVANHCDSDEEELKTSLGDKTTFWVGVIPGNPSEQRLLRWIRENERLEVFVDIDDYYVKRLNHEAGRFFREDQVLSNALWKVDMLQTSTKRMDVYPTTGLTAQVLRAKDIVKQLPTEEKNQSVIVVSDSKLVTPVMALLPDEEEELNITFGHKLGKTSIHRFVMLLLNLHANALERNGKLSFYHKQVADILKLPEVNVWLNGASVWAQLEPTVLEQNWKYISKDWLRDQLSNDMFNVRVYDVLFDWDDRSEFIAERISLILADWNKLKSTLHLSQIDKSALPVYAKKFNQLFTQFGEVLDSTSLASIRKFIHRHMSFATFQSGDSLVVGLQVMSLFETRMIDFKHVIFIGASDENLPGTPNQTTHIPFIHRKHFALPTLHDSQSLTAYHFYRLLQRASQVHFIYNTSSEALSGGEPSRYLLQLQLELAKQNSKFSIHVHDEIVNLAHDAQKELEIQKTEHVIEAVKKSLKSRLSPSAINKFINSPLEFYYYYVLRISEQDKVEEDMEANTFGSVVHDVLEELYLPFVGKMIVTEELKSNLETSDERVINRFLKDFSEEDISRGKNLIQVELAKFYVKRFVEQDLSEMAENGVVKILALEDKLDETIQIGELPIRLLGYADRIDERGGVVRIIDYKTGKVEAKELKGSMISFFSESKFSKALQLVFYKWAYARRHGMPTSEILSSIYSFRNQKEGYMSLQVSDADELFISGFEKGLTEIVSQMLDETQPFKHKSDSKYTTF